MKILGRYVYLPIALLAVTEFFAATGCLVVSAMVLGPGSGVQIAQSIVIPWALGFGLAVLIGLTSVGLYQSKQRLRIEGVIARVVVGLGLAAVGLALIDFFSPVELPGGIWLASFVLCFLLVGAVRGILWHWVNHELFQRRVLVYGAGRRAASLLKLRRSSDKRGFHIAAFLPAAGDQRVFEDARIHQVEGPILDYAMAKGIDEIVVAMDERRLGFPISDFLTCRFAGIAVVDLLSFLERETGKINIDLVNPAWLIFSELPGTPTRLRLLTRFVDLAAAAALLLVALPIMAVVALAILFDDGAPVIYRQTRVGLMGKTFSLYKFRSMIRDAEAGGTPQWAAQRDARVTRVGAILRKLRLDELPQLFNVLLGTMSLVGPRPERPEFVDRLSRQIPYYQERHAVKPGITGWAQLSYPYGASDHDALEKLQYDLYYIKNKSLIFDLMVLLQTAEVVLWRKGAR